MMGAMANHDIYAVYVISSCAFSAYSVAQQVKFCVINMLN